MAAIGGEWVKLGKRLNPEGYHWVCLSPGRKNHFVHHLVLKAFVGPRPPKMDGCHYPDHSPANNRLGNIRWATRKANMQDSVRDGRMSRGEHRPLAKLTNAKVRIIRRRLAKGESQQSIADHFTDPDSACEPSPA